MVTAHFTTGHGSVPANARRAGYEADRTLLYLAIGMVHGGTHPGKYREGWSAASVSYGGQEEWATDYAVWTGKLSDGSGGSWDPYQAGIESRAVQVGAEPGAALYAARSFHEGGWQVGKWRADWTAASIAYGGQEIWVTKFEVLVPGQYFEGDPIFAGFDE